jgi:hypothetical protein
MVPAMLVLSALSACDGPVECDPAPQRYWGGPSLTCSRRPNGDIAVFQTFVTPDWWRATPTSDFACFFERDGGTARYVQAGELCWRVPARDESDDLLPTYRTCLLPAGVQSIITPDGGVLQVEDLPAGGVVCRPS